MGPGAIQIEAISAYFWMIGLEDLELREAWLVILQRMDQAWLDHQALRQAQGEDKKAEPEVKK